MALPSFYHDREKGRFSCKSDPSLWIKESSIHRKDWVPGYSDACLFYHSKNEDIATKLFKELSSLSYRIDGSERSVRVVKSDLSDPARQKIEVMETELSKSTFWLLLITKEFLHDGLMKFVTNATIAESCNYDNGKSLDVRGRVIPVHTTDFSEPAYEKTVSISSYTGINIHRFLSSTDNDPTWKKQLTERFLDYSHYRHQHEVEFYQKRDKKIISKLEEDILQAFPHDLSRLNRLKNSTGLASPHDTGQVASTGPVSVVNTVSPNVSGQASINIINLSAIQGSNITFTQYGTNYTPATQLPQPPNVTTTSSCASANTDPVFSKPPSETVISTEKTNNASCHSAQAASKCDIQDTTTNKPPTYASLFQKNEPPISKSNTDTLNASPSLKTKLSETGTSADKASTGSVPRHSLPPETAEDSNSRSTRTRGRDSTNRPVGIGLGNPPSESTNQKLLNDGQALIKKYADFTCDESPSAKLDNSEKSGALNSESVYRTRIKRLSEERPVIFTGKATASNRNYSVDSGESFQLKETMDSRGGRYTSTENQPSESPGASASVAVVEKNALFPVSTNDKLPSESFILSIDDHTDPFISSSFTSDTFDDEGTSTSG